MNTVILDHAPAYVVRCLLIQLGMATSPENYDTWPVFISNQPDKPDECITVYDAAGVVNERHQIDGEVQEHYGIEILVRGTDYTARQTIDAIVEALDQSVRMTTVTIPSEIGTAAASYLIYAMNRTSGVIHAGRDSDSSNRDTFTVNYLLVIDQTGT